MGSPLARQRFPAFDIGSTIHLERRLEEHRRGQTHTTQRLGGNLELVAATESATLAEARALERDMKRKKNPQLALALLERSKHALNG